MTHDNQHDMTWHFETQRYNGTDNIQRETLVRKTLNPNFPQFPIIFFAFS